LYLNSESFVPKPGVEGALIPRCELTTASVDRAGIGLSIKETCDKGVEMKNKLSAKEREKLLEMLQARFEKNMNRHKGLEWMKVKERLESNPAKLWSLHMMETTGGEPDVVGQDKKTGKYSCR
jgi:hypothetical protein